MLSPLLERITQLPAFRRLVETIAAGRAGAGQGNLALPRAARLPVTVGLWQARRGPVLLLVPQEDQAWVLRREAALWLGQDVAVHVWVRESDEEAHLARLQTLVALAAWQRPGGSGPPLVVASAAGLLQPTWPRHAFLRGMRRLRPGDVRSPLDLARHLEAQGYEPVETVVRPGQFARRGGVLDLWPPTASRPVRVDFFGDEIESLRIFDPETQRGTGERLKQLWVPPLRPAPALALAPLWSWFDEGALLLVEDEEAVARSWAFWLAEHEGAATWEAFLQGWPGPRLALGPVRQAPAPQGLAAHFASLPRFGGRLNAWADHVRRLLRQGAQVWVVTQQIARVEPYWREKGREGPVTFVAGHLEEGFALYERPDAPEAAPALALFTDRELFGWAPPRPLRPPRPRPRTPEAPYRDFQVGDYVVHVDFGIGLFRGLVRRTLEGVTREYLLLEYAGGDQVYVPVEQADRVVRYVGPEGVEPALTRLGTGMWERVKTRTREAVQEVAQELLDLYARRQLARGHAFGPDTDWQRDFEARCPFDLTEDQRRAIEAVKRDMERPYPMDRLICGDAGFGKTEVALRAAFKAVMDGKQVALLAPTTVLAQQHFVTFRQRMAPYPIVVELLSRFRTPEEQARVLEGLAAGTVDIVIGTHRLLSDDVQFKDLGLVIIDEEHRFGVRQKEHFKRLRTHVDVLSLSATPIPRTLYMALTGVRDISIIRTPPRHRHPVITHVGPYDEARIREAIRFELARGGQVFYVHNRVLTLPTVLEKVRGWFPQARVAMAHGQMRESDLAEVMTQFAQGEVDILVTTSIIESGLDFPRANTLIVEQAETFGLAQLYQLRGRVGRGMVQGYAYFFWSPTYTPPPQARERLRLLAEHTELGAGFTLALHDLEMRGAGDLLGYRQHGHVAAVGYHLYTQMLAEAVAQLRRAYGLEPGERPLPWPGWSRPPVRFDLPLPATLPEAYIPDARLRLALYRRMATLKRLEEVEALARELRDRFGPPPQEVRELLWMVQVKILATQAGASSIGVERGQVVVRFPEGREDRLPTLPPPFVVGRHTLRLPMDAQGRWKQLLVQALKQVAGHPSE